MSVQPSSSAVDDDGPEEGEIEDDDEELVHRESSPPISTTTTSSLDLFASPARKHSYDRDIREFELRRGRTRRIPDESRIPRTMGTTRANDTYVETIPRARIKDKLRSGLTHGKENRRIHRERNRSISPTKILHHKKDKHDHQDRQISLRHSKQDKHEYNSSTHQHINPLQRTSSRSSLESEEVSSSEPLSRRRLRHKRAQRDRRKQSSSSDTEHAPAKRKPHHPRCPLIKVLQDVAKETRLAIETADGNCEERSLKKRLCNMGALSITTEVRSEVGETNVSESQSSIPISNGEDLNSKVIASESQDVVQIDNDTTDEITIIGSSRKIEPEVVTLTDSEDNGSFDVRVTRNTCLDNSEEEILADKLEDAVPAEASGDGNTTENGSSKPVAPAASEFDEDDIGQLRLLALQSKKNEQTQREDEDDLQLRLAALKTAIVKKFKGRKKGAQQASRGQKDAEAGQLSPIDDIPLPTSPGPTDEVITPVDMELAETDDEMDSRQSTPEQYSPSYPTESPAQEVSIRDLLPPPPPPDLPLDMYFPDVNPDLGMLSLPAPPQLLPPPLPHFFRDMLSCIQDTSIVTSDLALPVTRESAPVAVMSQPSLQIPEVTISSSSPSTEDDLGMDIVYDENESDSLATSQAGNMEQSINLSAKPLSTSQVHKQARLRPNLRPIPLSNASSVSTNQHKVGDDEEALEEDTASPVDLDSMIVLDEVYDNSPTHEVQCDNVISLSETEPDTNTRNQSSAEDDEEILRRNLLLEITNKRENTGSVCIQDASSAQVPIVHNVESSSKTEHTITSKHSFEPISSLSTKVATNLTTKTTNLAMKATLETPPRLLPKATTEPTVEPPARDPTKVTCKPTVELASKHVINVTAKTVESNAKCPSKPTKPVQKLGVKSSVGSSLIPAVGTKPAAQACVKSPAKPLIKPLKASKSRLVYSSNTDKTLQVILPVANSSQPAHKLASTRINTNHGQVAQDSRLIINLGIDSDSSDDYSEAEALGQRCVQNKEAWNRVIMIQSQDYEQNASKPSVASQKGVKTLTRNSAVLKKTSLQPGVSNALEDPPVPSETKDLENSIDRFLKGVRNSHDAIYPKVASSSKSPVSSLSHTPVAVRNLPVSLQEEYKRLKRLIAEREKQMKLKKQCKTVASSSSSSGHVQSRGLNNVKDPSNQIKVAVPQNNLNVMQPRSILSNSSQNDKKAQGLQTNATHQEHLESRSIRDRVNVKSGNSIQVSLHMKKSQNVRGQDMASVHSPSVSSSESVPKTRQTSAPAQTIELQKKRSLLANASHTLSSSGDQTRLQEVTSVRIDDAPLHSVRSQGRIGASAVHLCEGLAKITNQGSQSIASKAAEVVQSPVTSSGGLNAQSESMLSSLEGELLSGRSEVLDELSRMVALLAQVDTALEAQSRTANEVSTLVDQLRLASGRLRAQNRMVTDMVGRVAQRQKDLSQGQNRFLSVLKKCSEHGKQLLGSSYKVPSDGACEMRAQLRLVHEQTQSLALKKAQEQEKRKFIWKRVEECLSKILQSENVYPKKPTVNMVRNDGSALSSACLRPSQNSVQCSISDEANLLSTKPSSKRVSIPVSRTGVTVYNSAKPAAKRKSLTIRGNLSKGIPSNFCPELVSKILAYRFAQKKLRTAKYLLNASQFKKQYCKYGGRVEKCRKAVRRVSHKHHDKRKESSDMEISTDGEENEHKDCQVVDMSVSPDTCSSPASISHNSTEEGELLGGEACTYESSHRLTVERNVETGVNEAEGTVSDKRTLDACAPAHDQDTAESKLLTHSKNTKCGITMKGALDEPTSHSMDAHPLSNTKRVLKDYVSPLGSLSGPKNTENTSKDDPHAFLCPYDLNGKCKDTDCPFKHQL